MGVIVGNFPVRGKDETDEEYMQNITAAKERLYRYAPWYAKRALDRNRSKQQTEADK